MGSFFSVRLAPGVRISASSRGLRAHVGPRGARVHVGGGRTGISTGTGPFTYYQSLGGPAASRAGTRRQPHHTGATARQISQADKAEQARLIVDALQRIDGLHRQEFTTASKPVAPLPALPPFPDLVRQAETEQLAGLGLFARRARREAKARARELAGQRAQALLAQAQQAQAQHQSQIDQHWQALLDNDEDVVLATLEAAFEDNEAPAAAVGVHDAEVFLAVLVPPVDVLPERVPTTTAAGNLSLRPMTKTQRAQAYQALVAGHLVVSVKEAFAVCPGLEAASVVALREEPRDVYGARRAVPVLATRLTRAGLTGVRWAAVSAWDVVEQTGTDTVVRPRGAARELTPLDLAAEPDLAALVKAVDLEELTGAERPVSGTEGER